MKGVFTGLRAPLWGPESKVQRCGAITRRRTPCLKPAEVHPTTGRRLRCRLHGGRRGPRAALGARSGARILIRIPLPAALPLGPCGGGENAVPGGGEEVAQLVVMQAGKPD